MSTALESAGPPATPAPVRDPRDQSPDQFLAWAQHAGFSAEHARRILAATLADGILDPHAWVQSYHLPRRLFQDWRLPLPRLELETSIHSSVDHFEKLRFRLPDGLAIETVLIPLHKPGAVSLCLSSQVGCAMGCAFCATARMPVRRNLAAWEIIDQVLLARAHVQAQGRRVTGIVFMGMGEPFLNYDRVLAAAELLRCPFGFRIAAKAQTISTVGIVPAIDRYTAESRPFRLSISLTAVRPESRHLLLPQFAHRWSAREIMDAARRHALARRSRINLAYVCISGCNCDEQDALALAELVADTPVRLDLIDVTDPTGRFQPPAPAELKSFRDALTRHLRQPVARRYSGGADIAAACGTLANLEPIRADSPLS